MKRYQLNTFLTWELDGGGGLITGRLTPVPLDWRLDGPQSQSRHNGNEKR
jgi:hypothetical protein